MPPEAGGTQTMSWMACHTSSRLFDNHEAYCDACSAALFPGNLFNVPRIPVARCTGMGEEAPGAHVLNLSMKVSTVMSSSHKVCKDIRLNSSPFGQTVTYRIALNSVCGVKSANVIFSAVSDRQGKNIDRMNFMELVSVCQEQVHRRLFSNVWRTSTLNRWKYTNLTEGSINRSLAAVSAANASAMSAYCLTRSKS